MPAAEIDVTPDLVRALLEHQHPDLAGLPLTPVANGWDNVVLRLGDDLAVRMPRRVLAAKLLRHEQRWLPILAPRLPLPIPAPVRIGEPGPGYPWPWSVVPYLAGEPASDAPPADFRQAAADLGHFLGALHIPAAAEAPVNPFRGVPLAQRSATFAENLVAADVDAAGLLPIWEHALAAPTYTGPPLWLHGDTHPANLLVAEGRLSAVIDFGDITAGDPASDLSVAWMLLPLDRHDVFRDAYREAGAGESGNDDALWIRARGWALNFAIVFLAHSADNPQLRKVGHQTLNTVLA
jgi:aminoglycoside phosphotransferase (APT) family kinase protein